MNWKYWLLSLSYISVSLGLTGAGIYFGFNKFLKPSLMVPAEFNQTAVLGLENQISVTSGLLTKKLPDLEPSLAKVVANSEVSLNKVSSPPELTNLITPVPSTLSQKEFFLNQLLNGDFELAQKNWQMMGEVIIGPENLSCTNATGLSNLGSLNVAKLGSETSSAKLGDNSLFQQLSLDSSVTGIQFWYRVWTKESALGFDDPVLIVSLNDELLWRIGASTAIDADSFDLANFTLACSGWRLAQVPFRALSGQAIYQLKFISGQTGDLVNSSWVEIGNISLIKSSLQLINSQIWPVSVEIMPELDTGFMVTKLFDEVSSQFTSLKTAILQLQTPVLAWRIQLLQPLVFPYQVSLNLNNLIRPLNLFLLEKFPFSLDHEGFSNQINFDNNFSFSQLKIFKPSWLKIENLWQQPLMVLPINSSENELL